MPTDPGPVGAGLGDGHHRALTVQPQPEYLADTIAYLGGSLLIHSWWPLVVLPCVLLVMRRMVVDREERYLSERFR